IDASGRDRLAASGAQQRSADSGVSGNYQQLICQGFGSLPYCAHDDSTGRASGSGWTGPRSIEGPDRLSAPTTALARPATPHTKRTARSAQRGNRALETVDRETAAHAIGTQVGKVRATDRTVTVAAGRAGSESGGAERWVRNGGRGGAHGTGCHQ